MGNFLFDLSVPKHICSYFIYLGVVFKGLKSEIIAC